MAQAEQEQPAVLRCGDCGREFEVFSDLADAGVCLDGGAHRSVRIRGRACSQTSVGGATARQS